MVLIIGSVLLIMAVVLSFPGPFLLDVGNWCVNGCAVTCFPWNASVRFFMYNLLHCLRLESLDELKFSSGMTRAGKFSFHSSVFKENLMFTRIQLKIFKFTTLGLTV